MKTIVQLGTYFLLLAFFAQAQAQSFQPSGTYTLTSRTCADGSVPEDGKSTDLVGHLTMTFNANHSGELRANFEADQLALYFSYWNEGAELYSIVNGMDGVTDPLAYVFMKAFSLGYYLPGKMAQRLPMTSHRHIESVGENQIVFSQTPVEAAGSDKRLPLSCLASGKMVFVFAK